jgi:hypothetical protein
MEVWNTTNSTSKREVFAQVKFDLHGFNCYFFILLTILYIHFIYLKLSSNVLLASSHIASTADSPLKSDSLTPDLIEKEFSTFPCVYFKLVKYVYFLFDTAFYGHVDFPLLCHDCWYDFQKWLYHSAIGPVPLMTVSSFS